MILKCTQATANKDSIWLNFDKVLFFQESSVEETTMVVFYGENATIHITETAHEIAERLIDMGLADTRSNGSVRFEKESKQVPVKF